MKRINKIKSKKNLIKKDKITNLIYSGFGIGTVIFIMQMFIAYFLIGDSYSIGDICKLLNVSIVFEYLWVAPCIFGSVILIPYILINIRKYTLVALLSIDDDEAFQIAYWKRNKLKKRKAS